MDGLLSFLTPEQQAMAERQARQAMLTQLGFGLLQASTGAPGQRRPSLGQIVGQAGPGAMQAYQGSFDRTLQQMMLQQQMAERQRQKAALENLMRGQPPEVQARLQAFPGSAESVLFPNGEAYTLSEGQRRFVGGKEVAAVPKPVEETTEIRTLRALLANPDLLNAFIQVQSAKTPRTTNIFDMGKGQQELFKEVDVPIVQGFATAANSSREFARTSETINRLLRGKGGGEIVKIGTDLAKTLGLQNDQIAAQDLANSLVVQLAPRMRAPGSGSTSDIEFKSYISAVPSLSNSERGREIMAKYATAFANRNAKLADYAKKLASQNKLTFEAIATYDESLGPVLKEDFYGLVETSPAPSGSSGVIDFRSQTRGGR